MDEAEWGNENWRMKLFKRMIEWENYTKRLKNWVMRKRLKTKERMRSRLKIEWEIELKNNNEQIR